MMESSNVYKGWAVLQPLTKNDPLVHFVFPLDFQARYVIGSMKEDGLDLMVPPQATPIEAAIAVTDGGEVFVDRPMGTNAPIWVNGEVIEQGKSCRVSLASESTVSFGQWQYLYKKPAGVFLNRGNSSVQIDRCNVCNGRCQTGVQIMACGHNMCTDCRRRMMQQDRMGYLACKACRSRITSVGVPSVTASKAVNAMGQIDETNGHRPICDGCQNGRGLFISKDYDYCEECQKMICPSCGLASHRHHKLRQRANRLRDLDQVEEKLETMKKLLRETELLRKEAETDPDNPNDCSPKGHAFNKTMRSMGAQTGECRQLLFQIQQRKRALARGWDETSRGMEKMFNHHLRKTFECQRHLQRLLNGEASIAIELSSPVSTESSQDE